MPCSQGLEGCIGVHKGEERPQGIVLSGPDSATGFDDCKDTHVLHLLVIWQYGALAKEPYLQCYEYKGLGLGLGPAPLSSDPLPSFLSPQGGESGEEQLCADFPELDLSQLDTSDFDSAACFGELQWCPENSETEPGQYSPDDCELFQVGTPPRSCPARLALPSPPALHLLIQKSLHPPSSWDPAACLVSAYNI